MPITDGDGSTPAPAAAPTGAGAGVPPVMPGDKARTSAILIPPDCDAALMGQIAARVVTLSDLRGLAEVMTLLLL